MKKILNVLLAIDGDYDEQAILAEVMSVAKNEVLRITLLCVSDVTSGNEFAEIAGANLQERETEARSIQSETLAAALVEQGIHVTIEHARGKPHLEIIRRTLDKQFDVVMKPARREVGLRQFLVGGTDMQLLSLCPVPVWIFQPNTDKTLRRIAVAVDLMPTDPERTALAHGLLSWGKYLAALMGAELHVIHAWSLYRESSLRSAAGSSVLVDELVMDKERLHRRWLDDALLQAGLLNKGVHRHLIKGDAKQVIPQLTDSPDVDLLIMGTVGRTGISGFFIGNTADSVLRKVSCSVLAIKPERFSTPVKSARDAAGWPTEAGSWRSAERGAARAP